MVMVLCLMMIFVYDEKRTGDPIDEISSDDDENDDTF